MANGLYDQDLVKPTISFWEDVKLFISNHLNNFMAKSSYFLDISIKR